MSFKSPFLASALVLTACVGISSENGVKPDIAPTTPVVEIAPDGNPNPGPLEIKLSRRDGVAKKTANTGDPILERQDKILNCISKVDGTLLINCMKDITDGADCYNAGVRHVVDASSRIPECRQAIDARSKIDTQEQIYEEVAKESRCIDLVLRATPNALENLDACFNNQIACLRKEMEQSGIVCDVEQEDALLARKK